MTPKKKAIALIIIAVVFGGGFALFYMNAKDTQRDMQILKIGIDNDPTELMMSGNMSIQDYCDHFQSSDPSFCNEWKK